MSLRVHALWHYPVKSVGGCSLPTLSFDPRGVVGDRAWAVKTEAGKIGSGKHTRRFERVDGLLGLSARRDEDGSVWIEFSDGRSLSVDGSAAATAVSEQLGRELSLAPEREVPHFDAGPVHILSVASLDWAQKSAGTERVETKRFRPNVVVEGVIDAHGEEAWVGKHLQLGTVRLQVLKRTERCRMVTLEQPGVARNDAMLRCIAQDNDSCFGVYASVVEPGRVEVGDELRVEGH